MSRCAGNQHLQTKSQPFMARIRMVTRRSSWPLDPANQAEPDF